ncbi:MAG TPA: hypothetical protein VIG33_00825 [Pseudobdellovibrionaceae bacterium]|jgi:hypothetical protein
MDKTVMIFLIVFASLVECISFAQDSNEPAENIQFKEAIKDFQSGHLIEARAGFLKLVELEPKRQIYWFNLCHTHYKLNNFQKASDCYKKVREWDGSLSLPAAYYQAVCENNMGRSKKAVEIVTTVIEDSKCQENLRAKAVHFKKAVNDEEDEASVAALKYFNEGDYEKSLKEIEKSDLSETPEAFLLRGMSYKSLHKNEEAKKYLQLTERYTQRPDIRESSRALAADLNEKEKPLLPGGFSGEILFDVGSDSNIYQVKSATASSITNFNVEVNYRRDLSPQSYLIPGYSFKHSRYLKNSDLNTTDHFFELDLGYNSARWLFEVSPFFEVTQTTFDLLSLGSDFLVKLDYDRWALGFSGTISEERSLATAENYMNGDLQTLKLFLELNNTAVMVQLYMARLRTATGDMPLTVGTQTGILPLAYSGTESGLYTVIALRDLWKIYGRMAVTSKNYDRISTPSNVKRNDLTTNLYLKIKYAFSSSWSGFASFNFFNNQSTLGTNDIENKNYAELISKFGLQWSW